MSRSDAGSAALSPTTGQTPCRKRRRCLELRWMVAGVLFGAFFPLIGWLIALSPPGIDTATAAHADQPVLYIVDMAPFILGLTGYAIGHFHARLTKTRLMVERTVQSRTAELRGALDDLSATQAEKDRFVAGVSHELRTPLTSVVGLARTLTEPDQNLSKEEHDELLSLIVQESEEVASIVEDLLVAARIDHDQISIASRPLRLDEETRGVTEVCDVDLDSLRTEPVTVSGDPVRLHQIVRNLITNAARYGGGTIRVAVHRDGQYGVLAVCDNGTGVPSDEVDLIFTAFGKAHHDPERTESIGLGLTVSRSLAELMGGDLTYVRNDGWTCFELRLPALVESAMPPVAGVTESSAVTSEESNEHAITA